jgi:hypothetical protein
MSDDPSKPQAADEALSRGRTATGRPRSVLAFVRRHGLRLFLLSVLATILSQVPGIFDWLLLAGLEAASRWFGWPQQPIGSFYVANIPFISACGLLFVTPLVYGYWYIAHGALNDREEGVRSLFIAYRNPRVFMNLVLALAIATGLFRFVDLARAHIPWPFEWTSATPLVARDSDRKSVV